MLSAKGLLDALSQEDVSTENYKNSNNVKTLARYSIHMNPLTAPTAICFGVLMDRKDYFR